jgi:hypothetical protein
MNIQLFSIHDVKAGAYLPPFTLPTTQMAKRTFADTVNDRNHSFSKHPEDYTLFHIGEFDDESGMITNDKGNKAIANGKDFQHSDFDYSNNEEKISNLQEDFAQLYTQVQELKS